MSSIEKLDPTKKPPESLRVLHKYYQQAPADVLATDTNVLDLHTVLAGNANSNLSVVEELNKDDLGRAFTSFEGLSRTCDISNLGNVKMYEHPRVPGLRFLPSLLPQHTQGTLLSRLLHRDLSNPSHKTNVHFHHAIPYHVLSANSFGKEGSLSFFDFAPTSSISFPAIDPDLHKPVTLSQFLRRKLRWMTLGGQYDWTNKVYREDAQPSFPRDVADLIHGIFPQVRPEAAIVNFYSPGDTLSMHRDVSESCDAGLVSISLGCDGLFLAGLEHPSTGEVNHVVVRLRSGDGVLMSGPSRLAWHSVPQILANTCPSWLNNWPADTSHQGNDSSTAFQYEAWRGWMANKRINLNIRQMHD